MTKEQYEQTIALTANYDNLSDHHLKSYLTTGLSGEVGEVCNLIKKDLFYTNYSVDKQLLEEELGDCLYYLINLINVYGFSLDNVMSRNCDKVEKILAKKSSNK